MTTMKISVVTITCRANGRLAEMARCLAATFQKAGGELELEWIIVDELAADRDMTFLTKAGFLHAAHPEVDSFQSEAMVAVHIAPPITKHRIGGNKAVAHNTARNAGLLEAKGDYVIFLNDCNMVTADWASVARDACIAKVGWKCKMQVLVDMKVPEDGLLRKPGHHDLMRPVPVLTAASASWGAPREAFEQIRGFDLAYDGERYANDLDAIVRLSRIGTPFVTTARAFVIQLRRTKIDKEITTRKDVYAGVRNKKLFARLQSDKDRITPIWEVGEPEPVEAVPAVAAPAATPSRAQQPPRARFVQCPAPPKNPGAAAPRHIRPSAPARAPIVKPAVVPAASQLDADLASLTETNGASDFDGDVDELLD